MSRKKWLTKLTLAGTIAASVAIWNQKTTHAGKLLSKSLPGSEHYFLWNHGKIYYTKSGNGVPLLLLHRIGTGVSSFEWRRLAPLLHDHFEVYTPDLLGFGKSEKPNLNYSPDLYAKFINDFVNDVVRRPVHLVSSTLSSTFALRSASKQPTNVLSLTIISPPALDEHSSNKKTLLKTALTSPVIGTTIYNSLASKTSIRYYLQRNMYFDKKMVTPDVVNYYYQAAHQDGIQARRAPTSYISGQLHTPIERQLKSYTKPLFMIAGEQSRTDLQKTFTQYKKAKPDMDVHVIGNSGMLPHEEQPEQVAQAIHSFITGKSVTE